MTQSAPSPNMTVREAAEVLRKSEHYVRELLKAGRLPGIKAGHAWLIPADLLEQYLRERQNAAAQAMRKRRARSVA